MNKLLIILVIGLASVALAGEIQSLFNILMASKPQTTTTQTTEVAPQPSSKSTPGLPGMIAFPGTNTAPITPINTGISEIGIERTRCLTNCPAYSFIISSNGNFRYVGEFGVERLGDFTGQVEQGRLNQLLAFIDEANYMSLQDSYTSAFLDSATTYTMIVQDGETKVIQNYANTGPATLWAIEQLIDDLLETATWDY